MNRVEYELEEDCVDVILKYYDEKCKDDRFKVDNDIWIRNASYLRKLVNRLETGEKNYNRVKNCLILLINLCFGLEDADIYDSRGKSSKVLTNSEKEDYRTLLREEGRENLV